MVPNLVNNGILSVAGAAAFTALIVQQTKFLVEYIVKPADKNHDAIIRLYVDVVAIAVVVLAEGLSGLLNVHNGQQWFVAIVQGFGVAVAAISGYHLLNGMQPQTPSVPASAPAANPVGATAEPHAVNGAAPVLQAVVTPVQSDALPAGTTPLLQSALVAETVPSAQETRVMDNGTRMPGTRSISMSFVGAAPADANSSH